MFLRLGWFMALWLSAPSVGLPQTLLDVYRSGRVVLAPDPAYAADVNWDKLAPSPNKQLTAAPDGSVFISSGKECRIFKFDPSGRLVAQFGQKGQGPGDFQYPGTLSILDQQYLVVSEFAESRRFSLFDLSGKFAKLHSSKKALFGAQAIGGGRVAAMVKITGPLQTNGWKQTAEVIVIDTASGVERKVFSREESIDTIIKGRRMVVKGRVIASELSVASLPDGVLAVGDPTKPAVDLFSPEGAKIRSIVLKIPPLFVTREYLASFKKGRIVEAVRQSSQTDPDKLGQWISEEEDGYLGRARPYFTVLWADDEGRLLVFKSPLLYGDPPRFQVYDGQGTFLAEAELDAGPWALTFDSRFRKIAFSSHGVFSIFPRLDDEMETPVLARTRLAADAGGSGKR